MFTKLINLTLISFLMAASSAEAARVIQSKNNKIMIDLEGENASPQQDLFLINSQNKKVALAKILQVKNGKAVAAITKGKSDGTETVQLIAAVGNQTDEGITVNTNRPTGGKDFYRTSSKKISAVINIMSNTMTTKQADGTLPIANVEDVPMKGSTFGITGIVDWPVYKSFVFRGTAGYEPFQASGTAKYRSCNNLASYDCTADITYLSTGGYLRYDFYRARATVWGAVGATFKLPMTKSTTALKADDIKMTTTYALSGGVDYFINHKYFIPASFEYQMFLKSETVDASIMMLRAGFGMAF